MSEWGLDLAHRVIDSFGMMLTWRIYALLPLVPWAFYKNYTRGKR